MTIQNTCPSPKLMGKFYVNTGTYNLHTILLHRVIDTQLTIYAVCSYIVTIATVIEIYPNAHLYIYAHIAAYIILPSMVVVII